MRIRIEIEALPEGGLSITDIGEPTAENDVHPFGRPVWGKDAGQIQRRFGQRLHSIFDQPKIQNGEAMWPAEVCPTIPLFEPAGVSSPPSAGKTAKD